MNSRIEELAKQAFGTTLNTDPILFYEAGQFAELIVNHAVECVRDLLRNEQSALTYTAGSEVQERLREYFGVPNE